jgi:hypothetical protein
MSLRTLSLLLTIAALACAMPVRANPGLTGSWNGNIDGTQVNLMVDGKGSGNVDGVPMRYQVLGNMLFVERQGQVIGYQFELRDGKLLVAGGDLPGLLIMSKGSGAAQKPGQQAGGQPGQRQAQAQGGIAQELVGKWCLVTNFSANAGGGSSSSTCFQLNPNGTYTYNSERSMSAYAPGMWGGTSSNNSDSGRWSAAGNTITAMSNNGKTTTYQLEKRNHPKTRDAMLCLDGECYVTYFNRPRW